LRERSVMSPRRFLWLACGALVLALTARAGRAALPAAPIVRHPAPSGPLAARLDWALAEAAKAAAAGKGFWVGYGIRREMSEHSQMGVNVAFTSTETSLEDRIYGRRPAAERRVSTDVGSGARVDRGVEPGGGRTAERKIVRELAVLLRFGAPGARRPRSISACTLSAGVALEDVPLYWLGPAGDDDSLRLLTAYYVPDAPVELRTAAVEAVALHRKPDVVVPFLERIVAGREPERMRADAAEYLGDQPDARALDILKRTARADASFEVRKAAVSGLAEMELPAAFDALVDLALHERETKLRIEAIEALGNFHTPAASKALVGIIKGVK
jgi:hypothetical protein